MIPEDRVSTHPGETLRYDLLEPMGLTAAQLAEHIEWPVAEVEAVVECRAPVTAELAWRLSMAFGTTPQFWLNLQHSHDLTRSRPKRQIPLLTR